MRKDIALLKARCQEKEADVSAALSAEAWRAAMVEFVEPAANASSYSLRPAQRVRKISSALRTILTSVQAQAAKYAVSADAAG